MPNYTAQGYIVLKSQTDKQIQEHISVIASVLSAQPAEDPGSARFILLRPACPLFLSSACYMILVFREKNNKSV